MWLSHKGLFVLLVLSMLGACASARPPLPDQEYTRLFVMRYQVAYCEQQGALPGQEAAIARQMLSSSVAGYEYSPEKFAETYTRYAAQLNSEIQAMSVIQRQNLCQSIIAVNRQFQQQQIHNAQMAVLQAQRQAAEAQQAAAIAASMPTIQPYQPVYVPPMVMPQPTPLQQPRSTIYCRNATSMLTTCW